MKIIEISIELPQDSAWLPRDTPHTVHNALCTAMAPDRLEVKTICLLYRIAENASSDYKAAQKIPQACIISRFGSY
jgi:hypothetical protein